MPRFRRPITEGKDRALRVGLGSDSAVNPEARNTSMSCEDVLPGLRNSGGRTPTMLYASLSRWMLRPRILGSEANFRRQRLSLMTTEGANPGVTSWGPNNLPIWGVAP